MPFHAIHDHTLDAKNRLTVPAAYRGELAASGLTVALALQPCLQVWPTPVYQEIAERALARVNPFSAEAGVLNRHLYGNTKPMELDAAGRIMVPKEFLPHARLSKEVVLVGAGQYFEIWDRASWRSVGADLIAQANEHIASLGHPA